MFDSPQKIKHQRRRKIPRAEKERLTGKKQKRQRYHAEG